jgi:hypothetical protein
LGNLKLGIAVVEQDFSSYAHATSSPGLAVVGGSAQGAVGLSFDDWEAMVDGSKPAHGLTVEEQGVPWLPRDLLPAIEPAPRINDPPDPNNLGL